jgi:hypothetical protein
MVAGIAQLNDLGSPFTQFVGDTEYVNPGGVNEVYWGVGINGRLDPQAPNQIPLTLANVVTPNSGPHEVAYPTQFTNLVSIPSAAFLPIAGYSGYAYTNAVSETNWVIQVVYAPTNYPPETGVDVRFAPPTVVNAIQGTRTAMVEFSLPDIDAVTGLPFTNRVYVIDTHAAVTNAILRTNLFVTTLQRPDVIDFATAEPPGWSGAEPPNAAYAPELISPPDSLTPTVTNAYAAVSVGVGTVSRVITTPGGTGFFPNLTRFLIPEDNAVFGGATAGYLTDPTNNPARIELNADSLDLYLARLKSDGLMSINARHFTGRSPVRTDSPLFRFNVGSTNGSVVVSNVVPDTVRRLAGVLSCWSGVWTNLLPLITPDPNDPALQITNTIEIRTHALIVDTSGFGTEQLVETMDAEFHSTHVEYHDNARITRELLIDAESFHNMGRFEMLRPQVITDQDFPRLLVLTNDVSGAFFAPAGFFLGENRTNRIELIYNLGTISASGIRLGSRALMNTGVIGATESVMELNVDDVKLDGGSMVARSDIIIRALDMKSQASFLQAGTVVTNPSSGVVTWFPGMFSLSVIDRLTDGGAEMEPNEWVTHDGFQLLTRPAEGDLLNTTIRSAANIYGAPLHLWAAEDRGAVAAGYSNNVAVGRLILDGRFGSLFVFAPAGSSNAIYVNFLEFAGEATNVLQALDIRPNFKIYFIDSNLPAEDLDGLFEGRLARITDANVGEPPPGTIGGDGEEVGVQVNLSLAEGASPDQSRSTLSWIDIPGGSYTVEYATNLVSGPWIPFESVSNGPSRKAKVELPGALVPGALEVYFRVVQNR